MKKTRRQNRRRSVNGIFLLDKPQGFSSNQALQAVKAMFYAQKAGHTGSLDPLATGMLPICFGQATKFSQYLLDADKVYQVTAKLGEQTSTGDSEGEMIASKAVPEISLSSIDQLSEDLRGAILQKPPMYSALKHKGEPLYKLARQGITVDRPEREIMIYQLTFQEWQSPLLTFKVRCSKGTYVRTLVEDIAERMGTVGHVVALHRESVGGFDASQMQSYHTLENLCQQKQFQAMDELLLPTGSALISLPTVAVNESMAFYLSQGNPVMLSNLPNSQLLRLMRKNGELLGVGEVLENGLVAPKRLISSATS